MNLTLPDTLNNTFKWRVKVIVIVFDGTFFGFSYVL